jgi:hypothetical protein
MTVLAQRDKVRVAAFNKCGNSSIITTFMTAVPGEQWTKYSPPGILNTVDRARNIGGYQGDLTNFHEWPKPEVVIAFLRNPARRALSAYQHFLVRKERYKFKELGFTFGMSFPDFVDHLLTVDLTADPHISPQTPDLIEAGGDFCSYLLAPLEMIGECWPIAMDNVGLGDVVPRVPIHDNKGDYDPGEFMTLELHDKLRELYSEDYNLWETIYHEAGKEISSVSDATH